jgi:hypothetical protein
MLNDLFNEILRRLRWAKERGLPPGFSHTAVESSCRIPIDEKVLYTVKIRDKKVEGVLVQSLFPDGEPHYYIKIPRITREEAWCLLNAAVLIVYGELLEDCDVPKR